MTTAGEVAVPTAEIEHGPVDREKRAEAFAHRREREPGVAPETFHDEPVSELEDDEAERKVDEGARLAGERRAQQPEHLRSRQDADDDVARDARQPGQPLRELAAEQPADEERAEHHELADHQRPAGQEPPKLLHSCFPPFFVAARQRR